MVLYNCPGRTGVDMGPETVAELSKHKGIVGIKEATGDLERIPTIRKSCGDDFLIYSGEDDSGCEFTSPAVGGDGVISVTANVAPAKMHDMLHFVQSWPGGGGSRGGPTRISRALCIVVSSSRAIPSR